MRSETLYLLFVFILFGFRGEEIAGNDLIIPGVQAGPIRLGYTTIEEARDTLGFIKPVVNNEYIGIARAGKHCAKGRFYEYYVVDSSQGLIIKSQCQKLHVVYEVHLFSNCKWKTADGFGIGSSFEEIKAKMGPPKFENDTLGIPTNNHGYSLWHDMRYDNIEFISFQEMDKPGGCCVDMIKLTCDKIIRPDAGEVFRKIRRAKCPPPCTKC